MTGRPIDVSAVDTVLSRALASAPAREHRLTPWTSKASKVDPRSRICSGGCPRTSAMTSAGGVGPGGVAATGRGYPGCSAQCREHARQRDAAAGPVHTLRPQGTDSSERLGRRRRVTEHPQSWPTGCRRLNHRYERNPGNHLTFPGPVAAVRCDEQLLGLTTQGTVLLPQIAEISSGFM
ncbi:protein of unknown function [Streptantibioticus cattleyicolor NRRL 8057 = DSM 46488]|nr:protein of unknown function [Streptantibioticus cattleyicolor NRRL 8057 = DSM 46488]